jgi:glyoxylase-like metal-dependent hydrolase (beta-lactamase superfamily II)
MDPIFEKILSTAERIDVGEAWFTVLKLPHQVYAIAEPKHHEMVIAFLIIGSQKSVLFDTGMGIKDIARVTRLLTDREVVAVNSHAHFDHVGDNARFAQVNIFNDQQAIEHLVSGWPPEEIQFDAAPGNFPEGYPDGFDPGRYEIKPVARERIHPLCDGELLDLGDRKLEVLHTPGHSPDSIVLLDRENRVLLTGDTFYPDWLYAFMSGAWGESNLKLYYESIRKICGLIPDVDYLYCAHVKPLAEPQILTRVAKALETLLAGGETRHEAVEIFGEDLTVHHFDGFSIVTRSET